MRESELLRRIIARSASLSGTFPHVQVGPGDDCAVVTIPGGGKQRLLLKVDQLVEGRHFTPRTPLDLIARKAIARTISDIAAMAGTPVVALAGASLPPNYPQSHADTLFEALLRRSIEFGCPLVGGDTATLASAGPLSLSITVVGTPHPSRGPVLRSGALPGDTLYVTGSIGGSFKAQPSPGFEYAGGGKHLTFQPRLREATWLADTFGPNLHAMMDVSDGLGIDASRLAERSGVAIEIDAEKVLLSEGERDVMKAVAQGEDYELLFAASPDANVPSTVPALGTPIRAIGTIAAGPPGCVILHKGERIPAEGMGWEHR